MSEVEKNITLNGGGLCSAAPVVGNDARGNCRAPIGVFDSGFGGLTVARELAKVLPHESIVYIGDSARCPYGPRPQEEVAGYVAEIGQALITRGVKMIVIACNTATCAGLQIARETFPVPVLGVVDPASRAAVLTTHNKRVGVIATKGTIESGAYPRAIRALDPDITVFSVATPRFVEIAERGVRMAEGPVEDFTAEASRVYIRPAFQEIARDYLDPLRRCEIDTLVLGCTHYPLLKALIGGIVGYEVTLISSAKEAALDVASSLQIMGLAAPQDNEASCEFYTTGEDVEAFRKFGGRVFRRPLRFVSHLDLSEGIILGK